MSKIKVKISHIDRLSNIEINGVTVNGFEYCGISRNGAAMFKCESGNVEVDVKGDIGPNENETINDLISLSLPLMAAFNVKEIPKRTIQEQIGEKLSKEKGGRLGFVCIWRERGDPLDEGGDSRVEMSVGEFLSIDKNKKGVWLIDGGWGGPPGPIHVRYNEDLQES